MSRTQAIHQIPGGSDARTAPPAGAADRTWAIRNTVSLWRHTRSSMGDSPAGGSVRHASLAASSSSSSLSGSSISEWPPAVSRTPTQRVSPAARSPSGHLGPCATPPSQAAAWRSTRPDVFDTSSSRTTSPASGPAAACVDHGANAYVFARRVVYRWVTPITWLCRTYPSSATGCSASERSSPIARRPKATPPSGSRLAVCAPSLG